MKNELTCMYNVYHISLRKNSDQVTLSRHNICNKTITINLYIVLDFEVYRVSSHTNDRMHRSFVDIGNDDLHTFDKMARLSDIEAPVSNYFSLHYSRERGLLLLRNRLYEITA